MYVKNLAAAFLKVSTPKFIQIRPKTENHVKMLIRKSKKKLEVSAILMDFPVISAIRSQHRTHQD